MGSSKNTTDSVYSSSSSLWTDLGSTCGTGVLSHELLNNLFLLTNNTCLCICSHLLLFLTLEQQATAKHGNRGSFPPGRHLLPLEQTLLDVCFHDGSFPKDSTNKNEAPTVCNPPGKETYLTVKCTYTLPCSNLTRKTQVCCR